MAVADVGGVVARTGVPGFVIIDATGAEFFPATDYLLELAASDYSSIQPYKVPATGETIPLLHIAPSKTDTERVLVASPELVHVKYRVLSRDTGATGSVPLPSVGIPARRC